MRDLTADEREIVAGGWLVDEYEEENYNQSGRRYGVTMINGEVIVSGKKKKMPIILPMLGFWDGGGTGSANGGGGGADIDATPDVRDVNCIELKPNVADLKAMHQIAVDAAKNAPLVSQTTPWGTFSIRAVEHGVMMYTLPGDPKVYSSERAIGTPDYIPNDEWYRVLSKMPAGAVIVGLWHSHPDKLALPSGYYDHPTGGGDWQFMKNLWAGQIGDSLMPLRVDPNATLYITGADGKTYVYDKSDYNRQGGMASGSKSCPVNKNG